MSIHGKPSLNMQKIRSNRPISRDIQLQNCMVTVLTIHTYYLPWGGATRFIVRGFQYARSITSAKSIRIFIYCLVIRAADCIKGPILLESERYMKTCYWTLVYSWEVQSLIQYPFTHLNLVEDATRFEMSSLSYS